MIKDFGNPEEAKKYSETVIREKTNKGYQEK
jgi:predicted DNA-binding WGR domain protein